MGAVLVDSNVILDILTEDPKWGKWSEDSLARAADDGVVAINPIIYAEVSVRFETIEEMENTFPPSRFARLSMPWEAAFLAGKCFRKYRKLGGQRRSPLPDFYIGAHAAVSDLALLTRDPGRYRTYFPRLRLISP